MKGLHLDNYSKVFYSPSSLNINGWFFLLNETALFTLFFICPVILFQPKSS